MRWFGEISFGCCWLTKAQWRKMYIWYCFGLKNYKKTMYKMHICIALYKHNKNYRKRHAKFVTSVKRYGGMYECVWGEGGLYRGGRKEEVYLEITWWVLGRWQWQHQRSFSISTNLWSGLLGLGFIIPQFSCVMLLPIVSEWLLLLFGYYRFGLKWH